MTSQRAISDVDHVAAYILKKLGPMSAMKLHKLVYYAQAWSLVWIERPLFKHRIEAWANGPVVPYLYQKHRREFIINKWDLGDPTKLPEQATKTVDAVLGFYGDKEPVWLSELTHLEKPWRDARSGLAPGESGSNEITHAAMAEYYGSLVGHGKR